MRQLSTPVPPPELVHLAAGHKDVESFATSRSEGVDTIITLLSDVGIDYSKFSSILDFGCGCGRLLAGWEGILSKDARLHGCDINPSLVEFCKNNIQFATVTQTGYYPPLPYTDSQFDFIYLCSVYTHLSDSAMLQWTGEIARILRSGGFAMITFHGGYYLSELAKVSKIGAGKLSEMGYYTHIHVDPSTTWQGSNEYATWSSPDFMKRLFIGFKLVKMFPGLSHGPFHLASYQDVALFTRR
jgi:SAM-dependent methyltransferase